MLVVVVTLSGLNTKVFVNMTHWDFHASRLIQFSVAGLFVLFALLIFKKQKAKQSGEKVSFCGPGCLELCLPALASGVLRVQVCIWSCQDSTGHSLPYLMVTATQEGQDPPYIGAAHFPLPPAPTPSVSLQKQCLIYFGFEVLRR